MILRKEGKTTFSISMSGVVFAEAGQRLLDVVFILFLIQFVSLFVLIVLYIFVLSFYRSFLLLDFEV